jgi:hypothetical protein
MGSSLIQTVIAAKAAFSGATGLSSDACHVHVGLIVFLIAALLDRRSRSAVWPWLVCLAFTAAGELVDRADDLHRIGIWRWWESRHDVLNTMFWPTILLLVARAWRR